MDDNNRYIFDKRIMKKALIKYATMFIAFFVLLIIINVLVFQPLDVSLTTVVVIDIAIALGLWLGCEVVLGKIAERKKVKKEALDKMKKMSKPTKSDVYYDEVIVQDVEVKKKDKK